MSADTIKSFLVALGFKVDQNEERKMKLSFMGMELSAKSLGSALMAMSATAVIAVARTANSFEQLYYQSQRINASAQNIRGFEAAIAQMGGSAQEALGSLESISQKMRASPGYEGMLKGMGVATRDQNNQLRDRVEVMQDLAGKLQKMEYHKANAYGQALGIDEKTLMAMRDPAFVGNFQKYAELRRKLGVDDEAAKSGKDLAYEYRELTGTIKAIVESIIVNIGKALLPILKAVNWVLQAIITAFDYVPDWLKTVLKWGLQLALLIVVFSGLGAAIAMFVGGARLLWGVIRIFGFLFRAISKLRFIVPILRAVMMIFRGIATAIMMTPIGRVLALIAALAALWQDYQTWKRGGQSLIDWKKWTENFDAAIRNIKEAIEWVERLRQKSIDFTSDAIEKTVNVYDNVVNGVSNGISDFADGFRESVKTGSGAFSFGGGVDEHIKEASKKYGLPEDVMRGFVKMEGGWTGKMSPTGAIGTGQFTQGTWDELAKTKEGQEIGMTKIGKRFRTAADPRFDKRTNTLATALLAKKNAEMLKKAGVPVTGENLYMMHNIGPGILPVLQGRDDVNAQTVRAMQQNGLKAGMSPTDFVRYQKGRYNKQYQTANQGWSAKTAAVLNTDMASKMGTGFGASPQMTLVNPYQDQTNKAAAPVAPQGQGGGKAGGVAMQQTTTINVSGVSDPKEAAREVAIQQNSVNTQMARNAVRPVQ